MFHISSSWLAYESKVLATGEKHVLKKSQWKRHKSLQWKTRARIEFCSEKCVVEFKHHQSDLYFTFLVQNRKVELRLRAHQGFGMRLIGSKIILTHKPRIQQYKGFEFCFSAYEIRPHYCTVIQAELSCLAYTGNMKATYKTVAVEHFCQNLDGVRIISTMLT